MVLSMLPFDAHNHVHMGPTWPLTLTLGQLQGENSYSSNGSNKKGAANLLGDDGLCGMAVMSTHPRDFARVLELASSRSTTEQQRFVIPCIGVHPWFLHELVPEDWQTTMTTAVNNKFVDDATTQQKMRPRWIVEMENLLLEHPQMPVGEIGLDGFHFDPITKDLTSSMDKQIEAFELQLDLAIRYQRPVSIHCVRAMGATIQSISNVQKAHDGKLPPAIYFHAFGGKVGTATQWIKTLEKKNKKKKPATTTRVFFGFAPIINFQSPKTVQILQEVGLNRLVLETDHEDAAYVISSMKVGVKVISKALGVTEHELICQTNKNVCQLYGIQDLPGVGL